LFGFGKKKDEEEPQHPAPASRIQTSTYAPGAGHVEEEVIEGEEMESAAHRRQKHDDHDLDVYEEETLPGAARTGALGELLQEAHLDHRIGLKLGQQAIEEDEDAFDVVEEEEGTNGAPPAPGQPRRGDRRDRGRRGRGGPGQGQRRGGGPSRRSMQTSDLPIISDLLKPGQEILVQIAKEPIAKKGARITSHIALPGRFLVFMPTVSHVGVSRKIESDEERHRLKRILTNERGEATGGFIVRTAAEGVSEDELRADLRFLMNLWNDIKQRSEQSKSPALIYHDLSLIERILRDQVSDNFSNIWVDSEADYERIVRFLNRFSPTLVRRVKLYTKETPLFEHFGVQDEISKALRSKVWLKSGGSIVINQTEALVAIDINTGKYVGKSARLEDTILKTNLDAVPEIVRQIRLRDLGGIIVIDFIDMDERKNRLKVMAALEEALKSDRAPTKVLQFNDFGLVAITRKRVKQSLERTLSVPCYTCQATGMVKSPATVCNEIWIELRKMRKHFEGSDILLRVHPETVKVLKGNNAHWLTDFEELIGKNVLVKSDPTLHPEQFDIQG
jgi:Rne/Rng family ribonuclease